MRRLGFPDVLAARAFIAGAQQAAGAAANSHVQLWHPAASGVIVAVTRIVASADSLTRIYLSFNAGAASTLGTNIANKILGGVAPASEIRAQNNGAILGSIIAQYRPDATFTINLDFLGAPIIVNPGQGLLMAGATQNIGITGTFEWMELPA